ncbi:MAG: hypothetical protein JST30_13945 [Armatimonadetes bacterium]|nr:hypothetical protein [Armatimonadota bacterium]
MPPLVPFAVGESVERRLTVTALECESTMKDVREGTALARSEVLTASGDRFTRVTVGLQGQPQTVFTLRCDKYALLVEATVEKGEDPSGFHRLMLFLRQPLLKPGVSATDGTWSVSLANPLPASKGELDVTCRLERLEGESPQFRLTQKTGLLKLGPTAQAEVTTVLTLNARDGRVVGVVESADLYADGMKKQTVVHEERPMSKD